MKGRIWSLLNGGDGGSGAVNIKRVSFVLASILVFAICGALFVSGNTSNNILMKSAAPIPGISAKVPMAAPTETTGAMMADQSAAYATENKDNVPKLWDRLVIRSATLQLTVTDVSAGLDRIRSIAAQHGGYVFSSENRQEGDYTYATVTIQVPSQEFDQIMPTLRKMEGLVVKVANENVNSSDVTEEYTDLQSQLRNLQATESRMLALQARADRMEDVLSIDHELRDVQGQIEKIQGRTNYLTKRAEMSTITIQLSPQLAPLAEPAPVNEPGWQPFQAASKAWNASLGMLAVVSSTVITLLVFFWWLVPVAALVMIFLAFSRRRLTRRGAVQSS